MKKWLFLISILLLFGCSPKAISYLNTEAEFDEFTSFRVVSVKLEGRKVEPESTKLFEDIKTQIISQMKARSYEQSSISPDLTLRYELSSTTRTEQNSNSNNFNNTFGYPNYSSSSRNIYESILLLELYDSEKKLVWQGSYDLKQEKKVQKASVAIKNAVDIIFTSYPYKAGSKEIHQELTSTKKKKND